MINICKNRKGIKAIVLIFTEIVLTGCLLCVISLFHHVIPMNVTSDMSLNNNATVMPDIIFGTPPANTPSSGTSATLAPSNGPQYTPTPTPNEEDSLFTSGKIIKTDSSYKSKYVNITCKTYVVENVTYHVQDIYVRNMSCFKTAFANDKFATGSNTEPIIEISKAKNAIVAINGDQYAARKEGVVIRNGYLYRDISPAPSEKQDICVVYNDGTMKIFNEITFDSAKELSNGAYQAWSFGPALVVDGVAQTQFEHGISGRNPRSVIGYFSPGHFCFVAVDGRQDHSVGLKLVDLAKLMRDLGCVQAYNLDGGNTSKMVFNNEYYSSPSGAREVSDIVYICDIFE